MLVGTGNSTVSKAHGEAHKPATTEAPAEWGKQNKGKRVLP